MATTLYKHPLYANSCREVITKNKFWNTIREHGASANKRIDNGVVRSDLAKVPKVAEDEGISSSNDSPLQDSEGLGANYCLHVVQKAA
jgi:hypothetical protein